MRNKKLKERDRWISLWNYLITTELELGTMFLRAQPDNQLFVVLGETHQVISLPRRGGDAWHAYFQTTYGFGEREKIGGFIYDALRSYAFAYGEAVELRRFARFNTDTKTVYLSAYNGQIYKIAGSKLISTVHQGTDDVFFADDDGGVAITPDIGPHRMLIDRLASPNFQAHTTSGITPEQQRMALIAWMFAVAFPDLLPAKPMLLLEGQHGSGKTSVITALQLVLLGDKRPLILRQDDEKDFGVKLLRNPIALLDNVDSYVEWLANAICAYATSGVWTKRKLYTDDDSVTIKPHAFVAFTTRNPSSFKREDVVDRCAILRFDRRKEFGDLAVIEANLLADRAKLLGEYLWYLGQIVDVLKAPATADSNPETYRMAGFAVFSRAVGQVMGWAPEDVAGMLRALQAERNAFMNEEDPLIDLINEWLRITYNAKTKLPPNRGRLIDMFELHKELESVAEARSITWADSPKVLVQKLRSPQLDSAFTIEQHQLGGRRAFRLWRKGDPRLESIEGSG